MVKRVPLKKKPITEDKITKMAKDLNDSDIVLGKDSGDMEYVSSGILAIDYICGGKGIAKGIVVEIFGTASAGKTTLALQILKNFQHQGYVCGFVDAEHTLKREWARKIGVDWSSLFINRPRTGEEGFDKIGKMVEKGIDLIVEDSVSALVPKADLEADAKSKKYPEHASLMSFELQKLCSRISKPGTTVIFLNQVRTKLGITFGDKDKPTGGRAMEFYASVRLKVTMNKRIVRSTTAKKKEVIGVRANVLCKKNKTGVPFRSTTIDIYYNKGISKHSGLLDLAVDYGFIKKVVGKKQTYKFDDAEFKEDEFIEKIANSSEFKRILFK